MDYLQANRESPKEKCLFNRCISPDPFFSTNRYLVPIKNFSAPYLLSIFTIYTVKHF